MNAKEHEPSSGDFISAYLEYNAITEVPLSFHRWVALSMVGVILNRQVTFKLGHFDIQPNNYIMLIGSPGTRKSTAIKIGKKLLQLSGFDTFSAEKTTKEKFLLDLSGEGREDPQDILDRNLFGDSSDDADLSSFKEMYIAADEFNDFIGNGNMEFISLLGSLWDFNGLYSNRIKNGKSVVIPNPTINILGGNTPTGFALAFPPEILGQGFFSRLLLIYGEVTGKKIAFPPAPAEEDTAVMVKWIARIRDNVRGPITIDADAQNLLDRIYCGWKSIEDMRFDSYSNRRFTHLLKVCILVTASRLSTVVSTGDVIYANTILTHAEHLMPKALGEFGSSKYSEVTHKILGVLDRTSKPMTVHDIFALVYTDLNDPKDVVSILVVLVMARKAQSVGGGYLSVKKVIREVDSEFVDFSLLTPEEREYSK